MTIRQARGNLRAPQFRRSNIGTAIALAFMVGVPSAFAFEFKSESGEVTGSFDTTLSVGGLWRMDKRDSKLISIANGGSSRDPNSEDGNLKYDNGELVSTVFKATHDLEVKYKNFGAFLRASYFYDPTIHDKSSLSSKAVDELGDNAEILDAYVYGTFDLGGRKLNLRLGKQVVSWGESTFIQNGINVLNPVNVSRLRAPGSELKEGFIPTLMGYGSLEITDSMSVEVALPAEWKETKIDPAGSFFSSNDFATEGGNRAFTGFGRRNDLNGAPGVVFVNPTAAVWAPRSKDREADDSGQYGIALRYFLPELNNTELGLYHVNYHSRTPFVSGYRGGVTVAASPVPGCTVINLPAGFPGGCGAPAGTYFIEYPEDIKLYGLSFNTSLPAGVALQGEYSYRKNQPLQLPSAELLLAAVGFANQLTSTSGAAAAAVPFGTEISGYRRVKMHQVQFTGTKAFGPTFGAEQFVTVGEVGFTNLDLPSNLKFAAPGCHLPQPGSSVATSGGSRSFNCFATENSWGYRLVGRLDYPNAIGAVTVSPRIAFSHDVHGRSPTFNEDNKAATFGVGFNYQQNWQADIGYTTFFGGGSESGTDPLAAPAGQSRNYSSGTNALKDRDFIAVSLSYSF